MRYSDLGLTVHITVGNCAAAGLTDHNHLLVFQDKPEEKVIDLGQYNKRRMRALICYLERLAIHLPE